jgi:TetR/AcrR family transcriptional regulator, cholesterol catabolism regulator
MNVELSRRERKKDETRHRIFHAAIDLFREKGFEQTTVDDITEKADVAKGTFFNYFRRKEVVLAFLSETRLQAIEEDAGAILAESRPAREKLMDLYTTAASAYEEDRELSRYVLIELMTRMFSPTEEVVVRWHEQIVRLVTQGQENGELRRDLDPSRAEAVLSSLYYATLYEWVCCTPDTFPLIEELRTRLVLGMEGIAS